MARFDGRQVAAVMAVVVLFGMAGALLPAGLQREVVHVAVLAGAAMALNLLVGTVGLISLGQGLFFGFGAYAVAIGTLKLGLGYATAVALGLLLTVPLSLIVALISLRARHLFFGLLTLAIGQVAFVLVTRSYQLTGGEDGLVGIPVPAWLETRYGPHLLAFGMLAAVSLLLLRLLASPFGAVLTAVRDNAGRVASLGGDPRRFEIVAMMVAGVLGSAFGMVAASTEGNVDPGVLSWFSSAMLLMMVALGGRSIFLGPVIGAVVLEVSRVAIQMRSAHADLAVGLLVVVCAVAFPEGIGRLFAIRPRAGRAR